MPNVVWKPQPRQAAFMARPEYEALYGGAAGEKLEYYIDVELKKSRDRMI